MYKLPCSLYSKAVTTGPDSVPAAMLAVTTLDTDSSKGRLSAKEDERAIYNFDRPPMLPFHLMAFLVARCSI